MSKYEGIPCCINCDRVSQTKTCKKCAVVYCKHYASKIDIEYCGNCISDFHVKETIMEKEVTHERPDGTVISKRTYEAKHLVLEGTDWMFAMQQIETLNDLEMTDAIEYHRAMISVMSYERQARQIERYKKLSGIKLIHQKHESQEEREKREAKELAKQNKKVKVKTKEASVDDLMKMLQTLANSGVKPEQLLDLLKGNK